MSCNCQIEVHTELPRMGRLSLQIGLKFCCRPFSLFCGWHTRAHTQKTIDYVNPGPVHWPFLTLIFLSFWANLERIKDFFSQVNPQILGKDGKRLPCKGNMHVFPFLGQVWWTFLDIFNFFCSGAVGKGGGIRGGGWSVGINLKFREYGGLMWRRRGGRKAPWGGGVVNIFCRVGAEDPTTPSSESITYIKTSGEIKFWLFT